MHFHPWKPFDADAVRGVASQNALRGGTGLAQAREDGWAGRVVSADKIVRSRAGGKQLAEAAE
jgi:hypothetical protein